MNGKFDSELNGADVHLKEMDGLSALDWAIEYKHPAVEAVLRAHIAHLEAARRDAEAEAAAAAGSG